MNENINIAEILKDAPKGTELWSPIVGEITFDGILQDHTSSEAYIKVKDSRGNSYTFMSTGELFVTDNYNGAIPISRGGMCVLFPSRDCLSWRDFKAPWKYKHFEPFQKVLVAVDYLKDESYVGKIWCADLYGHYDKKSHTHYLVGSSGMTDDEVISFKGNEDKL